MCLCQQVFDIETGFDSTLLNLNPDGWIQGVTTEKSWRMLYGMDVGVERQLIIAGARFPCTADMRVPTGYPHAGPSRYAVSERLTVHLHSHSARTLRR